MDVAHQTEMSTFAVPRTSLWVAATLTFTWVMWYTNELFRTSQKERKEGRKEETHAVFWNTVPPSWYVVWWISFASSRPTVHSGVCVCVPSRLAAKTFGVLDSVALWRQFIIWKLALPSRCWRHGHVFSNFWCQVQPVSRVCFESLESATTNLCPSWGSLGFLYVLMLRPGYFPPLTSLSPPLLLFLLLLLIHAIYNQYRHCCQNRRFGNWAMPGRGSGREDTWANALLCLQNVITCINYILVFIVGNIAGWADTPTGLRFYLARLFLPLLY